MIVFRLCKSEFATDLTGKGAELAGGRWNSRGTAMIYTCSSRSLCILEVAVHLPLFLVPKDYRLITLEIPDDLKAQTITATQLPVKWQQYPFPSSCQLIGDQFVKNNKQLLLKVPSAIVKEEWNFLLNPMHKDLAKVKILKNEPFAFDERLFGKKQQL